MKNIITDNDKDLFISELRRIFSLNKMEKYLNSEKEQMFFSLAKMLTEFNAHTNLTAITDINGVILRHFADSLTAEPYIPHGARLADVGTGGGFPTLPLAIVRPDVSFTAIDSTAKKLAFSELVSDALGLSNVNIKIGRAEELAKDTALRESFDVCCARAVASLDILCELCLPFVKIGGKFAALKGSGTEAELKDAENAIKKLGGSLRGVTPCDITEDGVAREVRFIIEIAKTARTDLKYPRAYAQIKAKPL